MSVLSVFFDGVSVENLVLHGIVNVLTHIGTHAIFFCSFSFLCFRGAGGMFDTRNPDAYQDEDPRKSISEAPSFEEYLKKRQAEGN